MSKDARHWVRSVIANIKPHELGSTPGELERHADKLLGLDKTPADDQQANLIFNLHMADDKSWYFANSIIYLQLKNAVQLHPLLSKMAAVMLRSDWKKKIGNKNNHDRDEVIVQLLTALKDHHGIAPMRNDASYDVVCGADIVADELTTIGIPIKRQAVEKVWNDRPKNSE